MAVPHSGIPRPALPLPDAAVNVLTATDARFRGEPWFDVRAYGATGDGVTDDISAIQEAVDAAEAVGGGTVYFPDGTYRISAAIVLHSGVSLKGNGRRNSSINVAALAVNAIEAIGVSAVATMVQVSIEDLKIVGPGKASGGTGVGVYCKWTSVNVSLERLWVTAWGSHGIRFEESWSFAVRDCLMDGNGGDGFQGLTNINHAIFDHNISISNAGRGYYVNGGASSLFLGCDAESNTGAGFDLRKTFAMRLQNCHMEGNGYDGTSANIYLHYATGLGDKAIATTIESCLIQGASVTVCGIRVDGGEGTQIKGNYFQNHVTDHILMTANSTRTSVGQNTYAGTGTQINEAATSYSYRQMYGPYKNVVIDFGSMGSGTVQVRNVVVAGASVGDPVVLGPPSTLEAGLVATGFVSAADIVTVRLINLSGVLTDPASATWRVGVLKNG